jgi:hypothetical protein
MTFRFPYAFAQLASVQKAAAELRRMFPDVIVTVTDCALELSNVPAEAHGRVFHAAAAELIGIRTPFAPSSASFASRITARAA